MPFEYDDGRPLDELLLAQRPADGRRFELRQAIVYVDPVTGRRSRAPARSEVADPSAHGVTDLASVPPVLWGFIASYGRQTAPALIHDEHSLVAIELARGGQAGRRAALDYRRTADRVFRTGLLEQQLPRLRAWLMWAWVSADRERAFGGVRGALLLVQAVLGSLTIVAGLIAGFWHPLWFVLAAAPALAAVPWWRLAGLQLLLAYGLGLLGPFLVVHLAALLPVRLVEAIVEVLGGRDPRTVVQPTVAPPHEVR